MKKFAILTLIFIFSVIMCAIESKAFFWPAKSEKNSKKRDLSQECDYWDNGKVRVRRVYDRSGNLTGVAYYRQNGTLEQSEKYGENGHKTEECYYNSMGRLKENMDGWAMMRWRYKNGNLVQECYYGSDGRLKECKQYNKEGDLVAKQYEEDNIDPDEEFNPGPTLAGETNEYYDSFGRPEGRTSVEYD